MGLSKHLLLSYMLFFGGWVLTYRAANLPPPPSSPFYKSNTQKRVWQTAGGQSGPRCLLWLIPVWADFAFTLFTNCQLPPRNFSTFTLLHSGASYKTIRPLKECWGPNQPDFTSIRTIPILRKPILSNVFQFPFRIESAGCQMRRRTWTRRRWAGRWVNFENNKSAKQLWKWWLSKLSIKTWIWVNFENNQSAKQLWIWRLSNLSIEIWILHSGLGCGEASNRDLERISGYLLFLRQVIDMSKQRDQFWSTSIHIKYSHSEMVAALLEQKN